MSRNLFYNPKYRTKQIFELNCEPDTQPGENEVFYWLSTANDKLYANYQMNGRSTLTFEISDPASFNPSISFAEKIKSIDWDSSTGAINYSNENDDYSVPLSGLINGASLDNGTLVLNTVGNGSDISVNLSSINKNIASVSFNPSNSVVTFTYNDSTSITLDLSALVKTYVASNTNSINTTINGTTVSAELKLSTAEGNLAEIKSDGLYVGAFEDADFSDFVKTSDLSNYVQKVSGKGLSSNDFTNQLKSKLENISTGGTEKIRFTSQNSANVTWNGNVATFVHTLNCIPDVKFYDNDNKMVLVDTTITTASTFTADFIDKQYVQGIWTCVVQYGTSF